MSVSTRLGSPRNNAGICGGEWLEQGGYWALLGEAPHWHLRGKAIGHHDGRPSIKRTPGANGMPALENACEALVANSFSDGDAILVIRDDGLCSLTKELTFGTGDPER
jgi:hypothetical protein